MSDSIGLNLPKEYAKFLVFNDNPKYLAWEFGKQGFFVEQVEPLGSESRGIFQRPTIVTVRYVDEKQISLLLKQIDQRLLPRRVFKSIRRRIDKKDQIDGFINNTTRNLVNIAKGKTIRIQCKDNKELQQKIYASAMAWNEKDKTTCKFDYDKYDVTLNIYEYETPSAKRIDSAVRVSRRYWVITNLQGLSPFSVSSNS